VSGTHGNADELRFWRRARLDRGMSQRGPYAKGVAKRSEILDAALVIIGRDGYSKATLQQLSEEVGLSQMGLLHYFGSKDALITAVLRQKDEVDSALVLAEASASGVEFPDTILSVVEHNIAMSGFVQLFSRLSNEAAESDHPGHDYFRQRYEMARESGAKEFARLAEAGRLQADADPMELSIMLFALMDGLQTQWMYAPDEIAMTKIIRTFLTTVGVRSVVHDAV
jgi:AcrR family transcriptional regulator